MLALITVIAAAVPVPAWLLALAAGALVGRSMHNAILAVREAEDRKDVADLAARYLATAIVCALAAIRQAF